MTRTPLRKSTAKSWSGQLVSDRFSVGLAAYLILALALGGASRDNALRLAVLELAALPLIGTAVLRLWDCGHWRNHRFALGIIAACVAVPLLQLVPLPPGLWQALPGREQPALALEIAGIAPSWSPYSLTPDLTMRSLFALTPPLAVFLAVLAAPTLAISRLPQLLLGLAGASLVLAGIQMGSGSEAFYPWEVTGRGAVVGFFANRNHLATLCLMALPFCALMVGRSLRRGTDGRSTLGMWSLLGAVILVALVAIQSRTGVVLALPMLLISVLVGRIAAGRGAGSSRVLAGMVAALITVAAVAWHGSDAVLARFDSVNSDMRTEGWPVAFEAAQAHLPGGAGMGAFDRVYRSVEPLEQVDETYFNRAHNDYLETFLEAGWLATAILIAFLIWLGRRIVELWRDPAGRERAAPAAAAAILAVLAHSFVDYPLRTVTITVIFTLCCALLERRAEPGRERRR